MNRWICLDAFTALVHVSKKGGVRRENVGIIEWHLELYRYAHTNIMQVNDFFFLSSFLLRHSHVASLP